MLYNLFLVTQFGHYAVIQGSVPSADKRSLLMLSGYIREIKPGHGIHYTLEILDVSESGHILLSEHEKVRAVQAQLANVSK
jgi:hypothetical protein